MRLREENEAEYRGNCGVERFGLPRLSCIHRIPAGSRCMVAKPKPGAAPYWFQHTTTETLEFREDPTRVGQCLQWTREGWLIRIHRSRVARLMVDG